MKQHNIFITEEDMERLQYLLDPAGRLLSRDQEHLETLEEELDRAKVVSPSQIPKDVVTMNSKVRVRNMDTGNDATYTLVFPRDADIAQGKISVLAPIGTAILGYRVGDVIEWRVPGGRRRLRVEEVLYQPEAAEAASLLKRRVAREGHSRRRLESPARPRLVIELFEVDECRYVIPGERRSERRTFMILTMAAIAVTTRKKLERTCPKCGKKLTFHPTGSTKLSYVHAARHDSAKKRD